MSNGFIPRRKPTISIDPKRMGSFDRIGAVPSSRGGGGGVGRLRDLLLSSWGHHFSHHIDGKGSRSVALLAAALVVTVLVCFGMFARGGGNGEPRHVVVFDAGSTGNRVHVFEFDTTGDGPRLKQEVFHAAKPGLKERAKDPRAAAALLDPLVATAMRSVPARARKRTPLTLRATAGLRLLPEGPAAADAIMDAVRSKLVRTGFDVNPSRDVSILSGGDEGLYGWVAVNYLLGRIGGGGAGEVGSGKTKTTVALADLGGGSAQLSYAVDADVASTAPAGYVRTVPGTRGRPAGALSAYVHSFNGYGLVAARHRILAGVGGGRAGGEAVGGPVASSGKGTRGGPPSSRTHACVHAGHAGHSCDRDCYGLDDKTASYSVTPETNGGSFAGCVEAALDAIDADEGCEHAPCSFGGAWAAPRAAGVTEFYAMSYVAERAVQCGAAAVPSDEKTPTTTTPRRLAAAGTDACATRVDQLGAKYPKVDEEHRPWLCADVAYVYALLTRGFGVGEDETVTLVDKIAYRGEAVEAAWALGDAIAVMEGGYGGEGGEPGVVTEKSRAR